MKNLFYLFIAVSFIFGSCEKDIFTERNSADSTEIGVRGKLSKGQKALSKVRRNARWLRFESQKHYDLVLNHLEQERLSAANQEMQRILRDDVGDGQGPFYDHIL